MEESDIIKTQLKVIKELEQMNDQLVQQNKDFLKSTDRKIHEMKEMINKQNEQIQQFIRTNAVTQIKVTDYTDIYKKLAWAWIITAVLGVLGFWWQGNKISDLDDYTYSYYKKTNNAIWLLGNDLELKSFQPAKTK